MLKMQNQSKSKQFSSLRFGRRKLAGNWYQRLLSISILSLCGVFILQSISTAIAPNAQLQDWRFSPEVAQLEFTLSTASVPKVFFLSQPPRLVVDLPDTKLGFVPTQQNYSGAIQRIRLSQLNASVTRIVMDLAPGTPINPNQVLIQPTSPNSWVLRPFATTYTTNNVAPGIYAPQPNTQPGIYPPQPNTQPGIYPPQPNTQPGIYAPQPNTQPGIYAPQPNTQPGIYAPQPNTQPGIYAPQLNTQPGIYAPQSNTQPGIYAPQLNTQPGIVPSQLPGLPTQPGNTTLPPVNTVNNNPQQPFVSVPALTPNNPSQVPGSMLPPATFPNPSGGIVNTPPLISPNFIVPTYPSNSNNPTSGTGSGVVPWGQSLPVQR